MRSLFFALVFSLGLFVAPSRAQIPPEPLYFEHEYGYDSLYGFQSPTSSIAIDKFNVSGASLVWVEIEVETLHERTSQAQNYDNEYPSSCWWGDDVSSETDCADTSKVRFQVPSGTWLSDNEVTYPTIYVSLDPYPEDEETRTQFYPPGVSPGHIVTTRLRHSPQWSGMVGSGTWSLATQHTATIGYGDEPTGGHCFPVTTKDWCNVSACAPFTESILLSALDNVYVSVHVTYAYTY